jgi:hypothetical protein
MEFIKWYVSVGCSIYLICFIRDAVNGFKSFRKTDSLAILRGFVGAMIWPYLVWIARF